MATTTGPVNAESEIVPPTKADAQLRSFLIGVAAVVILYFFLAGATGPRVKRRSVAHTPGDLDGDGIPNEADEDMDGDGVDNKADDDIDGDGIKNWKDNDIDGDGIPNAKDDDVDGDGIKNSEDGDVDGDGLPNADDTDVDGDGVVNARDDDIDGDGISNIEDDDVDGDGVVNSKDVEDDDGETEEGDLALSEDHAFTTSLVWTVFRVGFLLVALPVLAIVYNSVQQAKEKPKAA